MSKKIWACFTFAGDLTKFTGVYVRIEERVLSNIPKNPVWKLPTKDRFIFNIGNGQGWTIGRLRGMAIPVVEFKARGYKIENIFA